MIEIQEEYLLLFTDSFVSNLAINPNKEFAYYSMKVFGLHNDFIICIIAALAFGAASFINYYFGKFISLAFHSSISSERANFMIKLKKYIWIYLIFSFVPFWGKFIPVLAGMLSARLGFVLLIATLVKYIYYLLNIYS